MKLINKKDLPGLAMAAGVGVLTGLIYLAGKCTGEVNAYEDCGRMLADIVEKVKDVKPEE